MVILQYNTVYEMSAFSYARLCMMTGEESAFRIIWALCRISKVVLEVGSMDGSRLLALAVSTPR